MDKDTEVDLRLADLHARLAWTIEQLDEATQRLNSMEYRLLSVQEQLDELRAGAGQEETR